MTVASANTLKVNQNLDKVNDECLQERITCNAKDIDMRETPKTCENGPRTYKGS